MKLEALVAVKRLVAACLCAVTLAAVACADGRGLPTTPSATAAMPNLEFTATDNRSSAAPGAMHLLITKTCDAAFPATPICTVVSSPAGPIPIDTQAEYTVRVFNQVMSANVLLTTPAGDTASGHCTLSLKSGVGTCTFARGTGALAGFHTNVDVSFDFTTGVTTWEGAYHFAGFD
jgi:hypothetical protein